jgi:replicative DNA helicase
VTAADDPAFVSERALLGAAISSTDLAVTVVEQVTVNDVRDPAHRDVLIVLADLVGRGLQVSPAIVLSELAKTGKLTGRLDGPYLHSLLAEAALPSQVSYHVGDVKARAWKQRFWVFGTRCQQASEHAARSPEDDAELLQGWLDELSDVDTDDGTALAADLVHGVLDEIEQGSDTDVVPTGFSDLDALMSMRPGQLIVVGARPGGGKSTFGMDVARRVGIKLHEPVYFLTLEMSRTELMKRMISAEAKVSLHAILHHRLDQPMLTDGDWDRIAEATKRIEKSAITIDDASGVGLARIRARLRHMKRTTGVRLAVIDYLGILTTPGRVETRQQVIADLTRGLKQIAREIGIPIILLAQLNRQVMGRPDRRPMASDLKDSGAIEADADVVILLHREDMYEKESPRAGEADFIVDKHRSGPQATITVAFQGHYSRFMDMAAEPDPSTPAAHGHLRAVQ